MSGPPTPEHPYSTRRNRLSTTLSRSKRVDKFFEKGDVIYTGLRSVAGYNLLVFSKSKSKVVGEPSSQFE